MRPIGTITGIVRIAQASAPLREIVADCKCKMERQAAREQRRQNAAEKRKGD